jgi:methionine-rich copper-binding protein CopC
VVKLKYGGNMKKLIILVAFLLIMSPSFVFSHVYVLECYPEIDSTVEASPKKVRITFLGNFEPAFSRIEVFDHKGNKVSKKKTKHLEDNTIMEVDIIEKLDPGAYRVKWISLGLDGHKQSEEYSFTIK